MYCTSSFSRALQMRNKFSHARSVRGFSEIALIGTIAVLFNFDGAADLQKRIDKRTVIALPSGRQTPLVFGKLT